MDTAFVKPALDEAGAPVLVRMPERGFAPLPEEGATVPLDEYWHRRIRHGDVIEAEPPAAPESVEPSPEADASPDPAAEAAPATTEEA